MLLRAIERKVTRPWTIMEICGGQTHTLIKSGIDRMLPESITLVHGPGCPVCVTPLEMIDRALAIARQPGVIFTSFGDMLRVPGLDHRPAERQGAGRRRAHGLLAARRGRSWRRSTRTSRSSSSPSGFETTAPGNAMAVYQARQMGLTNFSMLVSHVLVPPAMEAILSFARQPGAGLPRRGPRLHGHGLLGVRADCPAGTACRSSSPASSRSTCCRASTWRSTRWRRAAATWRTSTAGW